MNIQTTDLIIIKCNIEEMEYVYAKFILWYIVILKIENL
jgi:hypothetical protein